MTIREIAEMIEVSDPEHGECDREKTFLLNALVEERAKNLHNRHIKVVCKLCGDGKHNMNYWRTQALDELNLKDVWLMKEE